MEKKLDKITSRDVDFAQWYTDVVVNADLMDYGQVKGMMVFKPYGYAIWENIQNILDKEFKKTGVENVYFPMLIPKSLLVKEAEHVEGFAPELATVTKVGDKNLEEDLYIRPTSEVLFMNQFAKDVKSYRDLPKNYNQWCSVLRWEKTTRPFLRTSEFLWQEGHTVHNSSEEAKERTKMMWNVYADFAENVLLLPVIKGKKTEKEKFAGAQETYTIESLMHDGQSLQAGTSHYFGDNFTKAFNIKFQNKNQKEEFAYSTSWGVSTRLIGAIIMTHSDDNGLVLPFKISPTQIQIINIKDTEEINNVSKDIKAKLSNYRVNIDNSDKSFGFKISEAEIKGIPFRIEVGPRDLANGVVTISTRNKKEKISVAIDEVGQYINENINEYDKTLFDNALKNRTERTFKANTIEEYQEILNKKLGFVLVPFCGRIECENEVKNKTQTNSRCIPMDIKHKKSKCFNCKADSELEVYFAKAY